MRDFYNYLKQCKATWTFTLTVTIFFTTLIYHLISLNPHSGKNTPPLYGDFEAQRHWLELTLNLPLDQWYFYNLKYWGLDYPPLTAYHSLLLAKIAHYIDPSWVALLISRGNETLGLISFMRKSAIVTSLAVYVPGVVYCVYTSQSKWANQYVLIILVILMPALSIIDHGHFQYNSAMLGFSALAFGFMMNRKLMLGSICFCCALMFKQMALFYALPVFFYLLGDSIHEGLRNGLFRLASIGTAVILTFGAILAPFATSWKSLLQLFMRIFPVERGLYEDKVANVWCALSVLLKLRALFSLQVLMGLSILSTLIVVLPSCIHLALRPQSKRLLYSLFNSSLGFFLFSFQVHEKSIMLPCLPMTLLMLDEPLLAVWFNNTALYSLFPLLKRDGLIHAAIGLCALWNLLASFAWEHKGEVKGLTVLCHIMMVVSCIISGLVLPPSRYPDLHTVINVMFSTGQFVVILGMMYWNQFKIKNSKKLKKKDE